VHIVAAAPLVSAAPLTCRERRRNRACTLVCLFVCEGREALAGRLRRMPRRAGVRTLMVRMYSERAGRYTLRLLLRPPPGAPAAQGPAGSAPPSPGGALPASPAAAAHRLGASPGPSPKRGADAPAGAPGARPGFSGNPGACSPSPIPTPAAGAEPRPEVLYEAAVAVEEAPASSSDSFAHGFWPPQGTLAGVPAGFALQARPQAPPA